MKKNFQTQMNKLIGDNLRVVRQRMNKSQNDFAQILGVSTTQFQKYEYGTNRISAASLAHLSAATGVPLAHFFFGHDMQYILHGGKHETSK